MAFYPCHATLWNNQLSKQLTVLGHRKVSFFLFPSNLLEDISAHPLIPKPLSTHWDTCWWEAPWTGWPEVASEPSKRTEPRPVRSLPPRTVCPAGSCFYGLRGLQWLEGWRCRKCHLSMPCPWAHFLQQPWCSYRRKRRWRKRQEKGGCAGNSWRGRGLEKCWLLLILWHIGRRARWALEVKKDKSWGLRAGCLFTTSRFRSIAMGFRVMLQAGV